MQVSYFCVPSQCFNPPSNRDGLAKGILEGEVGECVGDGQKNSGLVSSVLNRLAI
jgi:hypothetical protein